MRLLLLKAEQLGLFANLLKKPAKLPTLPKPPKAPPLAPGSKGAPGWYDAHGSWHYGTQPMVETPRASAVAAVNPSQEPPSPPTPMEVIEKMRAEVAAGGSPEMPPPEPPGPPGGPTGGGGEPAYDPAGKNVPQGKYAVRSRGGPVEKLDFYKVDVGKKGTKWEGWRFVSRIVGPTEVNVHRNEASDALVRIQALGIARSIALYGQQIGTCGICGLPLTNEESRKIGIGPICLEKHGDAYGVPRGPIAEDILTAPLPEKLPVPPLPEGVEIGNKPEPEPPPPPAEAVEGESVLDALRDEMKRRGIRVVDAKTYSGKPALAFQGNTYAHNREFQRLKAPTREFDRGVVWGGKHNGDFAWFTFPERALAVLEVFNAERARALRGPGDSGAGGLQPGQGEPGGPAEGAGGVEAGGLLSGQPGADGEVLHQPTQAGGRLDWNALTQLTAEQLAVIQPPEPATQLDPSLTMLHDDQGFDVRLIADAYKRGDKGFLLGNGTGTGKTFVALGAIKQLGAPRTLVIVPNASIAQQWEEYNEKFGYGLKLTLRPPENANEQGIFITTYAMLNKLQRIERPKGAPKPPSWEKPKKKPLNLGQFGLMIGDEVHMQAMKLQQKKTIAVMIAELSDTAKMAVFCTASPFESPAQCYYLRNIGLWPQFRRGAWQDWAENHGVKFIEKDIGWGKTATVPTWLGTRESKLLDMLRARAELIGPGHGIFRMLKINQPVRARFKKLTPDAGVYGPTVQRAMAAMDDLEFAAVRTNIQKRLLDYAKLDAAADLAAEAVKRGQHVVMMVSNVAPFRFSDPEEEEHDEETGKVKKKAMPSEVREEVIRLFAHAGLTGELPSPTGLLAEKINARLGAGKAEVFTGSVAQTKRDTIKAEFNAGRLPVLISTIAAGGTGLSLHDKVGDAPRTQINIGLPWTGKEFMQQIGRTVRDGTASPVEQIFLWTDHPRERRIAKVVAGRLQALEAVVQGEVEPTTNAAELEEFAIRGGDVEGDIDVDQPELRKAWSWTRGRL